MKRGGLALVAVALSLAALGAVAVLALVDGGPPEGALASTVVVLACGGYGTGWWVSPGYIVTAYHVVEDCGAVSVVRGEWSAQARVAHADPGLDLAVLEAPEPPFEPTYLTLARGVRVGDPVYVVGYPVQVAEEVGGDPRIVSMSPRVSPGRVLWLSPVRPVAEVSAPTDAGNSGGPVVNGEGDVAGVIIYARHGVVSEGYYMLTAPAIHGALEEWGVPHRVDTAWDSPWVLLGLGVPAAAAGIAYVWGGRNG